jgi:hypothetical protein
MIVSDEVPPMTFMLSLAALNMCFTLCLLLMGANKEAAITGLGTAFCAAGALLMSS